MNKVNEWASEHLDAGNTEKYSKCIQKRDELLDENDKFGRRERALLWFLPLSNPPLLDKVLLSVISTYAQATGPVV